MLKSPAGGIRGLSLGKTTPSVSTLVPPERHTCPNTDCELMIGLNLFSKPTDDRCKPNTGLPLVIRFELSRRSLADGTVALDLIGNIVAAGKTLDQLRRELDSLYSRYFDTPPRINVTGVLTDTARRDFLDSVDARAGVGGQARFARVTADGTLRLPLVGAIGVVGLTLDELEREVNARFSQRVQGIRISVVLEEQAPRFLYIVGEVEQPGRVELIGPTTVMQAIALAGGWRNGGNLRQVVVFRRDQNWRLMALRLDLAGGLSGRRPIPSDEIWLRDSDIVLVPKTPILRLADAVELYFSRTLYGIFPSELGVFDAASVNTGS